LLLEGFVETKFGTLACLANLNLDRFRVALFVNPYHTGQAVPRAAVGFLFSAMQDFSGEVVLRPGHQARAPESTSRGIINRHVQ